MTVGARTPDELETLLEDASLVGDPLALRPLFEDHAVLVVDDGAFVQGIDEITTAVGALWRAHCVYVAGPARIHQARDTALLIGRHVNVARRGPDGAWRFEISLLQFDQPPKETP